MVDTVHKKMKKAAVTEEDVCTLLQRYSASTVLSLLREVSQFPGVKIDWKSLVEKSKTGIKTAREYQMLWRHLAYRQPLIENVAADDQLVDDDSDLECELEACPPVSTEDALEASNCVKMLASGSANEPNMPNSSVEGGIHGNPSNNFAENLQVQKQSQNVGISGEAFDANGLSNNRKRRKWSEEEDQELITAVQKFGEGSWAAIIKGEFKGNRNATQLAQRWNIIRKKQGRVNIGGPKTAGPQLTEAQLATRRALDVALSTGCGTVTNGTTGANLSKTSTLKKDLPITKPTTPLSQPDPSPITTSSLKPTPLTSIAKSRPQKKSTPQPTINTSDSIQAAAVAAGARIGSPSDAASLLKAVQSKNAVHIRGGSSLIKTSTPVSSNPLPPNVHFIRTGLASTSTSSGSGPTTFGVGSQTKVSTVRPPAPPVSVSSLPKVRTVISGPQNFQGGGSDTKSTTIGESSEKATSSGSDVGPTEKTPNVGNSDEDKNNDASKQITEIEVLKINDKDVSVKSCTKGVDGNNVEKGEGSSEGLVKT